MTIFLPHELSVANRLAATIAWCEPRARLDEPVRSLRTILRRTLPVDRADDLDGIVSHRGHALARTSCELAPDWRSLGRLMVHFPDADTMDGGANVTSRGFFDWSAAPPWDTWVAMGRATDKDPSWAFFVLAWVPAPFIELAGDGIRGESMGSIAWLEDAPVAIREAVVAELR
jgi:hypothetical protein